MTDLDLNKYKEDEEMLKTLNGDEHSSATPSAEEQQEEKSIEIHSSAEPETELEASVEPLSEQVPSVYVEEPEENFEEEEKKKSSRALSVFEWVESAAFAVVLVLLLFTFIFRIVGIDGSSMVPTLHNKDRVIISNLFYTPNTGDRVVLNTSEDTIFFNGRPYTKPLIKRVIAVGGQTVEVSTGNSQGQKVYVDGVELNEDYVNLATLMKSAGQTKITVPEGEVFVMGDNRGESLDSRAFGCISESSIVGRALVRIFPVNDFDVLV